MKLWQICRGASETFDESKYKKFKINTSSLISFSQILSMPYRFKKKRIAERKMLTNV